MCTETATVYMAQVISWTLALFFSLFLKISLTEDDIAEPLMSRHVRDVRKVSVTAAGHSPLTGM